MTFFFLQICKYCAILLENLQNFILATIQNY